jgi:hypothetical protein
VQRRKRRSGTEPDAHRRCADHADWRDDDQSHATGVNA